MSNGERLATNKYTHRDTTGLELTPWREFRMAGGGGSTQNLKFAATRWTMSLQPPIELLFAAIDPVKHTL